MALIVFGIPLTLYGAKFLPWVVGLVSGFAAFTLVLLVCAGFGLMDYVYTGEELGLLILSFVVSAIIGLLIGALMKIYFFYGFVFIGFIAGYFFGSLIYAMLLFWLESVYVLFFTGLLFALIDACLCY